ncbi:MAG: hypothetical protein SPI77_05115 [Corynebacterium sp.]|nr:hypothetical protein [Corynebacterium sp.]
MDVEIWRSAYRHNIATEDIVHAYNNPLKAVRGSDDMYMLIGPARDGTILEIGFGDSGDIVHAMRARRKYWP